MSPLAVLARKHSVVCSCYEAAKQARRMLENVNQVTWMIERDGVWVVGWGPKLDISV